MTIDYDAQSEEQSKSVIADKLEALGKLVQEQMDIEDEIAARTKALKIWSQKLARISEIDIPELIADTGVSEVKLESGVKVEVSDTMRVSTTGKYRILINEFLKKHELDDIIKDELKIAFGKGESEKAEALMKIAEEYTKTIARTQAVNAQTFAALIRELLEKGEIEVPLNDLGVMVQKRTKLIRP